MATHHPGEELLLAYASGSLPEPQALLVATHMALCPSCRLAVEAYEALGGSLLEALNPEPLSVTSRQQLLGRLPRGATLSAPPALRPPSPSTRPALPEPLRGYIGGSLDKVAWRRQGSAHEARLLPNPAGFVTQLLQTRAGGSIPRHTHEGTELTLVLAGGFSDEVGRYLAGDVAMTDGSITHRPVADADEDCLCLIVRDAPLRFTGAVGFILNLLFRH
ncbi:ChrR family anti-sigma-E factor [Hypericibacter sp.]|uniref:ChrR family anti-sigma-E factor n=1 Tax=Hypericibacter sp. TaxID=2705401 RepID=UPI003D6D1798